MNTWPTLTVLGPLDAELAGERRPLGGQKQRDVLARLAVGYPDVVGAGSLAEAVWEGEWPTSWRSTLQAYVSRLRSVLGEQVLLREGPGYRLALPPDHLDAEVFRRAVRTGREALVARRFAQAANELRDALGCWSSPEPLGTATPPGWAQAWSVELVELRVRATKHLVEALIGVGSFADALDVASAVQGRPWDEDLIRLRMLALYQAGRQTEALRLYERFRHRLDEQGLEPGKDLQAAQLEVLRQGTDAVPPADGPVLMPRLLPPRLHRLVGRDEVLAEIVTLLETGRWVALVGLAGAGKSSIAVELAHAFDGLVCWVPAADETAALNAVTEFAFRVGVPRGLDRDDLMTALWERLRTVPACLLVLDGAGHREAVQWMVPPDTECAQLLVTSLDRSWGPGAVRVPVESLLTADGAALLLARSRGTAASSHSPDSDDRRAATELAVLLGGLPLALEQAGAYIDQTGMSLTQYRELLGTSLGPLLSRGAPATHPTSVTRTWELLFASVRAASPLAAELLETAAFLSSDGIPSAILPAGGQSDALSWHDAVAELALASLVDPDGQTLRVHPLVGTVIRSGLDPEDRRRRAGAAAEWLRLAVPGGPARPAHWPAWSALVDQVTALLNACRSADVLPEEVVPLVVGCCGYLRLRPALPVAETLVDTAIGLVRGRLTVGASPATRRALAELYATRAEVRDDRGRLVEATEDLREAVAIAQSVTVEEPEPGWARTWARLAHVLNCADQRAAAAEYYEMALVVLRQHQDTEGVASALIGLAYACWGSDEYAAAEGHCREAVRVVEEAGLHAHPLHPAALSALGMMLHEQGRWKKARRLQQRALRELAALYGDVEHYDVAYTLDKLGYVEGLLGHPARSRRAHARAAAMLGRLFGADDPRRAMALSNRGLPEAATGDLAAALATQRKAHRLLLTAYGPDHKHTRLVAERLHGVEQRLAETQLDAVGEGAAVGTDDPQVLAHDPGGPTVVIPAEPLAGQLRGTAATG